MRGKTLMAMLVMLMLSLAGCTDNGDDEPIEDCVPHVDEDCEHEHSDDDDHMDGNMTMGNETQEPNVEPTAMLTMTDDAGNVLDNSSFIYSGGNITFSAAGTTDSDGVVSLAGLAVQLGSDVRTAQLIVDGVENTVTMNFTGEGRLVAALSALDDDGARSVAIAETFINRIQVESFSIDGAAPTGVSADDCEGPGAQYGDTPLIDNYFSQEQAFEIKNQSRWIEATVIGDFDGEIAICDPDANALSAAGNPYVATDDLESIAQSVAYKIFAVSTGGAQQEFTVEVVVHWEPKPAAE